MTQVKTASSMIHPRLVQPQATENKSNLAEPSVALVQAENKQLTLSDEGRALLAALSEIEQEAQQDATEVSDQVESFTYGALGMGHPDDVTEQSDGSYTAGQYVKGALAVGALLLAIV